jgi:uncharacterized protein YhbP (UPF0306 family)
MSIDVEKIIREYLPDVIHMSLATSKDNKPWVCEVHYAFDEDLNLYYRSTTSRRHSEEIAANPNVAGNMVKQVGPGEPCQGVVDFEGTAQLLKPGPELDKAFTALGARLKIGPETMEEAKNPEGHQFYKITVANWAIFGDFDGNGRQKYVLVWSGGKR